MTDPAPGVDVLVFQHTHGRSHLLLGGLGLGERWAGTVAVEERDEPRLVAALDGQVVRVDGEAPVRVVGPYYAAQACVLATGDVVGVVGGPAGVAASLDADALVRVVGSAAAGLTDTEPQRDLVTELAAYRRLEELLRSGTVHPNPAQALADTAAQLLDASFVMVQPAPDAAIATARRGWSPTTSEGLRDVAALIVGALPEEALVIQDITDAPLPSPLAPGDGLVSAMVMPLTTGGFVLAVHTVSEPRGFTSLDTDLGTLLSEIGSVVLAGATTGTTLSRHIERVSWLLRRDQVTGLPDLDAWEDALDSTDAAAVIAIGVGPSTPSDRSLQVIAAVLQRQAQDTDLVARVSGWEFAMLLRGAGLDTAEALASTIHQRLGPIEGEQVRIGWAAAPDLPDARTAWRVAAGRMLSS